VLPEQGNQETSVAGELVRARHVPGDDDRLGTRLPRTPAQSQSSGAQGSI
jgi:hypothetical protein